MKAKIINIYKKYIINKYIHNNENKMYIKII